jgi:dTDP-4-dehydrorhamnose reductase
MKVAVIGANGQLGSDVCKAFEFGGEEVIALNHDMLDVSDIDAVATVLRRVAPDLVINTAAMHNVEACEADPKKSFLVNGIGARNLAEISNEVDCTLMHISTDYVFDGSKGAPYREADCPNPLNVYGNTKLSGEYFIRNIARKYFILRVSGIYGLKPCRAKGGRNFVTTMLRLAKERDEVRVVNDEITSPTYTGDIAIQILRLSGCDKYGLYHVAAHDHCSWYEFAAKIFELTNTKVCLSEAAPNEFPMKVNRPKYSVLENDGLKSIGLDIMPHWSQCLENYLKAFKMKVVE